MIRRLVATQQPAVDPDGTLAANSDANVATQKAVKTYVDASTAASTVGLFDFKGSTDCSANPNYPSALKGDVYLVSVAGKIGGASGTTVEAGDAYYAIADNAGGTEASVGASWAHVEHNLVAATVAPLIDGTAAVGTGTRYAREDHVHPTDTTRAPTASPTFTGQILAAVPGSASAPSYAFTGDTNTGFYDAGSSDFLVATSGGVAHMQWAGSESKSLVKMTAGAQFCFNSIISPSLTGSVNDYAPTNITTCNVIRLGSDGAYNITGLGGGQTGNVILLFNISAFSITLKNASASSATANRFACPGGADYVLTAGSCAILWYDATSTVWRVIGGVA